MRQSKNKTQSAPAKGQIPVETLIKGVLQNERVMLARAITLIESNTPSHIQKAQEVLRELLPHTGQSIRIGVTGAPGVGKSTFLESLGTYLCNAGHKVAVLAIDPTSPLSRGAILGDKTRMESLSRNKNAFIRPSPSGSTPGGVAKKTRETILLCEAAGYDIVLIETVGVGQSEITVRSMSDFFLLMILPGGGDELQGLKKGSVEIADALVINKADGDSLDRARKTREDYKNALHILLPATEGWETPVQLCSAINDEGVTEVWDVIEKFITFAKDSGIFQSRRSGQLKDWFITMLEEQVKSRFYALPDVRQMLPEIEQAVVEGAITPTSAVEELLKLIRP